MARPTSSSSPSASRGPSPGLLERLRTRDTRARRLTLAAGLYAVAVIVFAVVAGKGRLTEHTAFNHYAHLADAWLHGRQDLRNGPPAYAMGNDFAEFEGKTYISFPPFPALLMLPFVALAGSPEDFCDGQFLVWLAGLAPAFLFLVLEKLRRPDLRGVTRSLRSEGENAILALLYAFATPYFFTAVEGTVWFAAHVVGAFVLALYVLFALDAERPLLSGLALACAWMTRPTMVLAAPFFALEALRVSARAEATEGDELPFPSRVIALVRGADKRALARRYALFAAPILVSLMIGALSNHARFHTWNPSAGHEFLTVFWKGRIGKWGLFGYHYLAKNLGCFLTLLPWVPAHGAGALGGAPFKVNEHGLALWFTSPIYFWLFRGGSFAQGNAGRRGTAWVRGLALLAAAGPALLDLLYQNSGWRQFAYRFSNDYSVLLFVALACSSGAWKTPGVAGGRIRPGALAFAAAMAWSVGWNLFGAVTFDHPEFERFYYREGTQTVLYQPD